MPKYAEGARSSTGKYVVRGGKWMSVTAAATEASIERATRGAIERSPVMAPEERRRREFMAGSKVASAPYEEPSAAGRAVGAGIEGATMLAAGGGALGAAARGASGVLGGAARFAAANPNATIGAVSAVPELVRGDIKGAVGTAAMTAAGLKGGGSLLRFLSRFKGGGTAAAKAAQLAQAEGAAMTPEAAWFAKYGREAPEAVQAAAASKAAPVAAAVPSEIEAALQASLRAKAAPSVPRATVPGSQENLLLQLKDLNSTAAGRKQILEYIRAQPPEIARELRALLGPAVRSRVGVKAAAPAVQAQGVERTAEEWAKMAERLGASDIYRRLGR